MWSIIEKLPSARDYNFLREIVGWGIYSEDAIDLGLSQTLYCLCAIEEENCIGMARVVGDGILVMYIQDVIVLPAYRHRGIGTQMMTAVMSYIENHAVKNTIIGLMAAKGKESFYERFGFITRPNETQGAGMNIFWQTSI